MHNIQSKNNIDSLYKYFRINLLNQTEIKNFSKLNPLIPIKDILFFWSLIMFSWFACMTWKNVWVVIFVIPVISLSYHALFIIGHDAIHKRLSKSRFLNNLIADIFIFAPIGELTHLNGKNHLDHHRFLSSEFDPDRFRYIKENKNNKRELLGYLLGISNFISLRKSVFLNGLKKSNKKSILVRINESYSFRDLFILAFVNLTIILGLTLKIGIWAYPVLWLLPVYIAYLGVNIRSLSEHSKLTSDNVADENRLVTFNSNFFEKLFIAPMGMNYHATHHIYPSIPYYNLSKVDIMIQKNNVSSSLEWRESYLSYLFKFYLSIKSLKKKINKFNACEIKNSYKKDIKTIV